MPNRRALLQAGIVAASALFVNKSSAQNPSATVPALPPAIAGLKSMKDQAHPISSEERQARQEKARALMEGNALDAILLMEGTSLNYFTGMRWWGGERMFAMVLPAKGKAFYVCPGFEEGRAREQLAKAPDGEDADVRLWQEDESPYQRLAQGLKDRGISGGTLGMEETVRFVFSDGVSKAAPQAKIT